MSPYLESNTAEQRPNQRSITLIKDEHKRIFILMKGKAYEKFPHSYQYSEAIDSFEEKYEQLLSDGYLDISNYC